MVSQKKNFDSSLLSFGAFIETFEDEERIFTSVLLVSLFDFEYSTEFCVEIPENLKEKEKFFFCKILCFFKN